MSADSKLKFVFKVIVIGDGGVGKTCLTLTFVKKEFKSDYIPTLGVDIYMKEFDLGESLVTLIIWDIAGQEKFDIIRKQYYKGAQGVLLVFDLTRPETYYDLEKWYEELISNTSEKIPIILLANKSDISDQRKITREQIELMAKKFNCEFYETSAKTGDNVDKAFYSLLKKIIKLNLSRRV